MGRGVNTNPYSSKMKMSKIRGVSDNLNKDFKSSVFYSEVTPKLIFTGTSLLDRLEKLTQIDP